MLKPILFMVALIGILWLLLKYIYSYWERHGFPSLKPTIPIGNFNTLFSREMSFYPSVNDLYWKSEEPFVGIYLLHRPVLLIRDPELAYRMLIPDFSSFSERGMYHGNEKQNPLLENIISAHGEKWKSMRSHLSPSFSSGKLKAMFPAFMSVGEDLDRFLEPKARKNEVVEFRDLVSRFMMDAVVSVFFGVEAKTIQNPTNIFTRIHRRVNDQTFFVTMIQSFMWFNPIILEKTGIKIMTDEIEEFLFKLVKDTIDHRETTNEVRKDFMQLLIQLRNGHSTAKDGEWGIKSSNTKTLSMSQVAAEAFGFFVAATDTSTATASFALYELCQNPETLKRLQAEIDATLPKYNNEITYDAIKEMKYLDCCFQETLRKYPSLPALNRVAVKDYRIPNSKHTIKKGTMITIPIMSYQRDPKYFDNPNEFNPDRFGEGKNFNERVYMPFGAGPHSCIGMRMAQLSVKSCIVKILSKYNLEALEKKDMELDNCATFLLPKGGVNLRISMR